MKFVAKSQWDDFILSILCTEYLLQVTAFSSPAPLAQVLLAAWNVSSNCDIASCLSWWKGVCMSVSKPLAFAWLECSLLVKGVTTVALLIQRILLFSLFPAVLPTTDMRPPEGMWSSGWKDFSGTIVAPTQWESMTTKGSSAPWNEEVPHWKVVPIATVELFKAQSENDCCWSNIWALLFQILQPEPCIEFSRVLLKLALPLYS